MSQISMWLYPLALSALVALVIFLRSGIKWSWGLCLQQALMLGAAAAGFMSQPRSDDAGSWTTTAIWTAIGWIMFFIFNVGQRALVNSLTNDLSFLKPDAALAKCRWVPLLCWGPPGKFLVDMAKVIAYFTKNKKQEAEEILARWSKENLPSAARESLSGYAMLGRIVSRDWSGVVSEFEAQYAVKPPKSTLTYQMASRAYAELGRFEDSVAALEKANLPSSRIGPASLDTQFMTFFSVVGAVEHLKAILNRSSRSKNALPEYARIYWLARCYRIRGEVDKARELFEQCKTKIPPGLKEWQLRVDQQLANLEASAATGPNETMGHTPLREWVSTSPKMASREVVERAQTVLDRTRLVNEIVRPTGTTPACTFLMVAIILVFGISKSYEWMIVDNQAKAFFEQIAFIAFSHGVLDSNAVWAGQYWRLLTYQFLHAHITHLAFNVFALMWFGKLVETMFGSARFAVIFLLCGVFSGIAHIVFSPGQPAVGASGAIMGIFGAATAGMVKLKQVLPADIRKFELKWMFGLAVAQVIMDQLINYIASQAGEGANMPHIASYAHLGGMIAGFVIGLIVPVRKFSPSDERLV